MLTSLQQREVFHLIFLRHFVKRIKPNTYALKGGCNLRFFFNSIRYSEDMDLDIKGIEIYQLKEVVMDILESKALTITVRPFQIDRVIPPDLGSAKQTETVQRFKIHLITSAGEDLFTKIEFSKRKLEPGFILESVSDAILRAYRLSPLIVSHYPIHLAIEQKIRALADRAHPQARDVFDIYMLHSQVEDGDLNKIRESLSGGKIKSAEEKLFEMSYEIFRDAVCNYLGDEDRKYYDNPEMWEDIQIRVAEIISSAATI